MPDKCEVCGKSLRHKRMGTKYCGKKHQQWAYRNRKKVARKAASYFLDDDATADLKFLESISRPAADMVKMVASVAGKDIAEAVLGGVWDVLVKLNVFAGMSPVRVPLRYEHLGRGKSGVSYVSMD